MKKLFSILIALGLLPALSPVRAQQTLSMSAVQPPGVQNLRSTITGTAGTTSACYYVVVNYVGGSLRSAPICPNNIPGALSGSNYVQLTWTAVPIGFGVTYDVLKTAVNTPPSQGATVGLATGLTAPSYQDQGGGLSPYTLRGFGFQFATAICRLNNWDYTVPAVECPVSGGAAFLAQVPLADNNLGLQAHGPGTNIGMELLGKGTGPLIWDGQTIADPSGSAPNAVYSAEAVITLAQLNAGVTLIPANTLRTLKVVHALVEATGGNTAACTAVVIEDTNGTPVTVTSTTAATLTSGTVTDETISGVTISNFAVPLTAGQGLQIVHTGSACTTATGFLVVVSYKVNS